MSKLNQHVKIGNVTLDNMTVFAPLAGITNLPMRLMAKEEGCGLVCSEMVSSYGLVYQSRKTQKIMDSDAREKPLSVQIFGAEPAVMAEAACMIEASGADILDINFGCSVRKILKSGSGSALMRTPDIAQAVIDAVRKAVKIPLTIKIRTGWDRTGDQAFETARIAEDYGVDAIAIHPRLASQGFGGKADWSLIKVIKEQCRIPVIGNGDIVTAEDAVRMQNETGCDAVMIGRGAIGNPWIFSQVAALFRGEAVRVPTLDMRFDMMVRYLGESVIYLGEENACYMLRSRLGWFVKGMPHSSRFRESIKHISSEAEALDIIENYREAIGTADY
ncbi:MAG: tRNA dihydrouridine synthase DusB [Thermodesulfobacteriota bacterium]